MTEIWINGVLRTDASIATDGVRAVFDGPYSMGRRAGDSFGLSELHLIVPETTPPPEPPVEFFSFRDPMTGNLSGEDRWDQIRTDPGSASVASGTAGTTFKAPGNIGKALVAKWCPVHGEGYRHRIRAVVSFPRNAIPRQVFLFDLEASRQAGGGESEAGIRVKVNDAGKLEVAGDKIGGNMWRPLPDAPLLRVGGTENLIEVVIETTLSDSYLDSVFAAVNNMPAVRGNGRTLPHVGYKEVTASVIDRLQAGITANGGSVTQEVFMRDLTWTIERIAA